MEVRSIEAIIGALNGVGARYLVVGGLAVNAHGYARFTHDLDLVISLEAKNITSALQELEGIGYQPVVPVTAEQFACEENRLRWRDEKNMLVLQLRSDVHRRTPLDIFIEEPFDFELEWKRALSFPVSDSLNAPIVSLEALLEMKKAAGREKDLLDIGMLKKLEPYRDGSSE